MNPHQQNQGKYRPAGVAFLLFAAFLTGSALHAATFTVTTSIDEFNSPSGADVSLREALRDAAAAGGADTIVFRAFFNTPIVLGNEIVVNDASEVTIDASALSNKVTIDGGVGGNRIFTVSSNSRLVLRNLTLKGGNGGGSTNDGLGGAIHNSGTLVLNRCILTENTAAFSGGAICNSGPSGPESATVTLTECTLSGNSANNNGGAVSIFAGEVTFTRCTLSENTTSGTGGAIFKSTGSASMVQCTLSGNTAPGNGGAISTSNIGTCLLSHCTIVGNTTLSRGGGIRHVNGDLVLSHCLIAGNVAPPNAGGGLDVAGVSASAAVKNCIIAGNASTDVDASTVTGSPSGILSQGHNRVGDGNATVLFNKAGDVTNAGDPLVAPLADNGGPTKTHALLAGSPARNGTVGSSITTDQRGFAVFGAPDIGAYELWSGSFSLSATSFVTNEGKALQVTINLTPGHPGNATVRLFTVAGTATAADFTARPNTAVSDVVFLEGENAKVVNIPITVDTLTEGTQNFTVQLGTPTPAALANLGTPNTATVSVFNSIAVTNTSDSGPGSLRQALADAAASGGADVIGFVPALNGLTIVLANEIVIADNGGTLVDASSLPAGLTIDAGPGTNRHFHVNDAANLSLRQLTLTGGGGTGANGGGTGGAVRTAGAVLLDRCTFTGNTAVTGGAVRTIDGVLEVINCTFSGNTAGTGGAIASSNSGPGSSTLLRHCTIVGNTATTRGGGVANQGGPLEIKDSLITRNTAPAAAGGGVSSVASSTTETQVTGSIISANTTSDVDLSAASPNSFTSLGGNIVGTGNGVADFNAADDRTGIFTAEVNSTLFDNGGPTLTHAPISESFGRDAAVGTPLPTDQRGFGMVGAPDIGAFEVQRGGRFRFDDGSETALEGQPLKVTIFRRRDLAGTATVRVFTTPGTATVADFTGRPNTAASDVTFADGEDEKDVFIPITLDAIAEGEHTFTVSLGSPTPAPVATLISPSTCVVRIEDSLVVNNINDDGPGSLRRVLATATATPDDEVITFAAALNGKTITLGSEIAVNDVDGDQVTIDASALPAGLTIDGGPGTNRIFSFTNIDSRFALIGLNLTGGNGGGALSGEGGAVRALGFATMKRCTLFNNFAPLRGGAIHLIGQLIMEQCTISGNIAPEGGGIFHQENSGVYVHCTIFGNHGTSRGGGILNDNTSLVLLSSIVANNTAPSGQGGGVLCGGIPSVSHTVRHSIVAGNNGTDVDFFGTNVFNSEGGNHVGDGNAASVFNLVGDRRNVTDALVDSLAANGGPTLTCALRFGSPAINATHGSTVTTDQRGVAIAGQADIGAFEVQNAFFLTSAGIPVTEGQPAEIVIRRAGDLSTPASVRLFTTAGTAGAADFSGRPNTAASQVDFAPNQSDRPIFINTAGADAAEPNETFTVSLGTPSAGSVLAAPSSAIVVLRDTAEDEPPNDQSFATAAITFPANNAVLDVPVNGRIIVTGSASDNKAVTMVVFTMAHNINPSSAVLQAPGAATTGWTQSYLPITGKNTIFAKAIDAQGNANAATVSRTFTVRRPLTINISGVGSVSPGFAPSSFRVVGGPVTVTATPGPGAIFAGWSLLSGHILLDLGISTAALEKPTLTFIHREGLALRANFSPNPFVASAIGKFNGSITPSVALPPTGFGTPSNLSTEGYASFFVQPTGGFSGSLKIDGRTLPVAGTFDHNGVARFGTTRARTLTVLRGDKPAYAVSLTMDVTPPLSGKITGSITQVEGNSNVVAVSDVDADRAFFSASNPVPATAFNGTAQRPATGTYTVAFTAGAAPPGFSEEEVPQGHGYGSITLANTGLITMACTLADGTAMTMSTTISETGKWRLFSQLYPRLQGFIAANVSTDHAFPFDDMFASGRWVRPVLDTQHYPLGWQDGLQMSVNGSRYVVAANTSVFPLAQAIGTGNGNATLRLSDPLGGPERFAPVDVSPADVVTEVPPDATYSLSIQRATGLFSGTFNRLGGTVVSYKGIILQKNPSAGRGFYLTVSPAVKDYTGQSGVAELSRQ